MNLQNNTRNQHFISQAEQRLNASNSVACSVGKWRIYCFDIVDRENHRVKLRSNKAAIISRTLSLNDLFSFDVIEGGTNRYNFEDLFHQYESSVKGRTDELLRKLGIPGSDIAPELINLFVAKFLNFVRNPYSIRKVLNSFPSLRGVQPTDPVHLANFHRVLLGLKPHQRYMCESLGITDEDYSAWLGVLFLMLSPLGRDNGNSLDEMVKGLFESPELYLMVFVYTFDNHSCLLSDRGYSTPVDHDDYMLFDFNLSSKTFIRYAFANVNSQVQPWMSSEQVDAYKKMKPISAFHEHNNLDALEIYNKHVVYQCHSQVFCSEPKCFGVTVE